MFPSPLCLRVIWSVMRYWAAFRRATYASPLVLLEVMEAHDIGGDVRPAATLRVSACARRVYGRRRTAYS
jgi:hypothetical protein